jgi:putative peptidoglycan lipid II flippase
VLLVVLVFAALAVAGVLLGQVFGDQLFGDDEPSVPGVEEAGGGGTEAISLSATAFDPEGDGVEHDGEAPLAVDQNVDTAWTSEEYDSVQDFQGLKSGVGLVLTLPEAADLGDLGVQTAMTGWSAQVYVADAPAPDLAGWGEPVTEEGDLGATVTFDLRGHRGGAVLLWITNPGSSSPTRAQVAEVGLSPG